MLYEVPSVRPTPKPAIELVRSNTGKSRVWLYPITDTIVAAYTDNPPTLEELRFPVAVKKAIEKGVGGVFLHFEGDDLYAISYDGKKAKKYLLPVQPEALASVLNAEASVLKGGGILGILPEEREKVKELLSSAFTIAGLSPRVVELKVMVDEGELANLLSLKSFIEEFKKKIGELRSKVPEVGTGKVAVAGLLVLLGVAGYYFYPQIKEFKASKEKKTAKPLPPPPSFYKSNLGLYGELSKKPPQEFTYQTGKGATAVYSSLPEGSIPLFKGRNYWVVSLHPKPVRRGKACNLTYFFEEGSPQAFYFRGTLEDLRDRVLCLNKRLEITGIKDGSEYYFIVRESRWEPKQKLKPKAKKKSTRHSIKKV